MKKFLNLPIEKKNDIINAGLRAFGTNGYKKAYISDIASSAGISKSMVFHYFGTKKDLYLFLAEFSANTLMNEMRNNFNQEETDFFERIRQATEIEVSVMRKYMGILSFLKSLYFETDEEVVQDIKTLMVQGDSFRSNIALYGIDPTKFKAGIDPVLVMKMLLWFTEGYISQFRSKIGFDIDDISKEFNLCLNMLKQNFYKEEFL